MKRTDAIAKIVSEKGTDAVLITTDSNKRYAASGFFSSRCKILISAAGDAFYFTDSRYLEAAGRYLPQLGFFVEDDTADADVCLGNVIKRLGVHRLMIESSSMTMREYGQYADFAEKSGLELVDAESSLDRLKAVLSPEDRECLRVLQSKAEKSLADTIAVFKIGMTERDLASELIYHLYKNGAEELSFKPEIISGANAAMPHGEPSDKPIMPGDAVIMDFGMVQGGFWSDMSRTFAAGYATDELRSVYKTVLGAQLLAIDMAAPGVKGRDLDAAAREYIEKSGHSGCYRHALSHSIGHMGTAHLVGAGPRSNSVLAVGNTISVEPGIYQEGKLGCRIEDLLWIGENGNNVNLNAFPKEELIVIG